MVVELFVSFMASREFSPFVHLGDNTMLAAHNGQILSGGGREAPAVEQKQQSVTFGDVAIFFTVEEQPLLDTDQKKLHKEVMQEVYEMVASLVDEWEIRKTRRLPKVPLEMGRCKKREEHLYETLDNKILNMRGSTFSTAAATACTSGADSGSDCFKCRGISWRHEEIIDLLNIWGREKMQEQLRMSHRNFDCFIAIAREMRRRGHNRTAEECRRKTKSLRLEYKRVLYHNSCSGSKWVTCPYFEELHSILHGDASVAPKRLASSLAVAYEADETKPGPSSAAFPESRGLFFDDLLTIDIQSYCATQDLAGVDASSGIDCTRELPGYTFVKALEGEESSSDRSNHEENNVKEDGGLLSGHLTQSPTDLPTQPRSVFAGFQSPAARLATLRGKKKRVDLQELVESLIHHTTLESRRAKETALQMDQALLQLSIKNLQKMERAQQEWREHRKRLLSIFERRTTLLEALVSCSHGNPSASNHRRHSLFHYYEPEMARCRRSETRGEVSSDVGIPHQAKGPSTDIHTQSQ